MNISKSDKLKQKAKQLLNQQKWAEAKKQLEKLCKKFPNDFDAWYLHGALCGQMNNVESAVLCCEKALSINNNHAGALYNYGMALTRVGNLSAAVNAYTKASTLAPNNPAIFHNLGNAYLDLKQFDNAITQLKQCITLDPNRAEAFFSLGTLYTETMQPQNALEAFEKSIALDASIKPKATYFISALKRDSSNNDNEYNHVKKLHDNHASTFDSHLQNKLGYKIPNILFNEYQHLKSADKDNDKISILDLGCGTGLCGIEFKDIPSHITGVDLSPGMIEKAKLTNTYDELVTDELYHYLINNNDKTDLILSADVFIYVGNIDDIIPACAKLLNEGGLMIFSVEATKNVDYKLRVSGRYSHSKEYIERLARQSKLKIVTTKPVVIRKEIDKNIDGFVFALKK